MEATNHQETPPGAAIAFPLADFRVFPVSAMKKLTIGKKTMISVKLQVVSILQSLHKSDVYIDAVEPVRFDCGNYFLVRYHTAGEPDTRRSRYFAHQKFRDCCDVWLESPAVFAAGPHGGNAA